jgi:ferrous iron transport protein A
VTTLSQLPTLSRAVVVALPHFRGLAERLISMGLTPGAELQVLQNRRRGPLIVEVHGVRLALGRVQAARVTVAPLPVAEPPVAGCEDPRPRPAGPEGS